MRKTVTLITTAVLTGLMFSACQPTPAEEQVIQKETLHIEQAETSEAEETNTALLDIPDTYEGELIFANGALKVQIQAEVVKPDTTSIPVARLIQKDVDDAMKDTWLNFLSEGKPLYYVRSEEEYSKAELEELLLEVKSGVNSDLHARDPEAYFEMFGDDIKRLEALYAAAPETPTMREYDKDSDELINLEVDLGKAKPASLMIEADGISSLYFMNLSTGARVALGSSTKYDATDPTKPDILPEDAQKIAEQHIEGLGFSDFALNNMGFMVDDEKASQVPIEDLIGKIGYDILPKCYVFYFTKTVGGMSETHINPQYRDITQDVYAPTWAPECVQITVSDTGVQSVVYVSSPGDAEIIENNVKIISFDDVIDRFAKQVELNGVFGSSQYDENIIERRVNIDRIELGGMRIISKDNADEYLFIPVWSFFGSVTEKWADGTGDTNQQNENGEFTQYELAQCILTINAIDGSVINRSLGY